MKSQLNDSRVMKRIFELKEVGNSLSDIKSTLFDEFGISTSKMAISRLLDRRKEGDISISHRSDDATLTGMLEQLKKDLYYFDRALTQGDRRFINDSFREIKKKAEALSKGEAHILRDLKSQVLTEMEIYADSLAETIEEEIKDTRKRVEFSNRLHRKIDWKKEHQLDKYREIALYHVKMAERKYKKKR